MDPVRFKERVTVLLGEVAFLGPQFDAIVQKLSDDAVRTIITWLQTITERKERALLPTHGSQYKSVPTGDLLVFRKELSIEGKAMRILLVKIKNAQYWEFHLGKHAYYDEVSEQLQLRRSS